MSNVTDGRIQLYERLSPNMPRLTALTTALREIYVRWGNLQMFAQARDGENGGVTPTIVETRKQFEDVECALAGQLLQEELRRLVERLASYAEVVANILVRNLFERTADVAFLASDTDIRRFMADPENLRERMHERLVEYRAKYTVYDDIAILDATGNVLVRLSEGSTCEAVSEGWAQTALSRDGYVETFGKTALFPKKSRALLYAHRIVDGEGGRTLGVLVLSFDFDGELSGIYRSLRKPSDLSVTLLLDGNGTVIATSDDDHVPIGARMAMSEGDSYGIIPYRGTWYVATTRPAREYQGYSGPGWFGHDMVSLQMAFDGNGENNLKGIGPDLLEKLLGFSDSLCPELALIMAQAAAINDSLRRVVWDGQIAATKDGKNTRELQSILGIVSITGNRTSQVFGEAISALSETVLANNLENAMRIASLAIDIMDRNLYERADDCRWWALESTIRSIVANKDRGPDALAALTRILEAINEAYSVYVRIVVFDASGTILAASNYGQDPTEAIGTKMPPSLVANTLGLRSSQAYCVSPFEATPLYSGHPTYVYSAAIRADDGSGRPVGGIGIVFDSGPQFRKMIDDCLPGTAGAFGLFVERDSGRIIATSKEGGGHRIGETLRIDRGFFEVPAKTGMSRIIAYRGTYYVVGCHASRGYREYKTTDGYANDVLSFVFLPIGKEDQKAMDRPAEVSYVLESVKNGDTTKYFGTFFVNGTLYAVNVDAVMGTTRSKEIKLLPGAKPHIAGMVNFRISDGNFFCVVPVLHGCFVLNKGQLPNGEATGQVIVMRAKSNDEEKPVGLLVDELESVIGVPKERVQGIPSMTDEDGGFSQQALVLEGKGGRTVLVSVINPDTLLPTARRN